MEILPMRPLLGFGRATEIQPQGDVAVDLLRRAVGVHGDEGEDVSELRFDDDGDDEQGEGPADDDNNSGSDFSFEFSSSMCVDLSTGGHETMLTADELFFNGKLRPLAMADSVVWPDWYNGGGESGGGRDAKSLWADEGSMSETETATRKVGRSLDDSTAMAMAAAAAGRASRRLSSLHENPRCVSMTVEGSRRATHRSCVSLNSSRCSSPSRSRMIVATASAAAKEPRTTPSSPKSGSAAVAAISAPSTLRKKSGSGGGRLLDFFKLRKGHHSHASGKESLRSFWPFSRSNSAGESKSGAAAAPLPRRSNSAGENKTTSSLLLPANAARKNSSNNNNNGDAAAKGSAAAAGFPSSSTDSPPLDNVTEKLRDLQLPKDSAKQTSADSYAIMPELQMEQWFSSSSSTWLQKSGPITAAEHRKAQGMVARDQTSGNHCKSHGMVATDLMGGGDDDSEVAARWGEGGGAGSRRGGAAARRGLSSSSISRGGGTMMVGRRRRDGSGGGGGGGGGGGSGSMRANCPVLLNVATPSSNSKLFFHLGHLLFSSNSGGGGGGGGNNKRDEKLQSGA